jgi:hypothetical protein
VDQVHQWQAIALGPGRIQQEDLHVVAFGALEIVFLEVGKFHFGDQRLAEGSGADLLALRVQRHGLGRRLEVRARRENVPARAAQTGIPAAA